MPAALVIDAIVLRFRDKGVNVTDTIEEHKKIINSFGYVWWGWWAKDHENTPVRYFKSIRDKIINGKCAIFLLNTKTKKVYEATCSQFLFSEKDTEANLSCPEKEKTPSYYNDKELKLWLRLTKIEEVIPGRLIGSVYSFCKDDPTLFQKAVKNNHYFAAFSNCKVTDIEELVTQRRTIWFLKKQQPNDSVVNLSEWAPIPVNFAKHHTHVGSDAHKILLLSDLHFTNLLDDHGKNRHNFRTENDDSEEELSLLQAIEFVVERSNIDGFSKIAGVIISGDFVFIPNENEFEIAKKFIRGLLEKANLKVQQLAIVPGNHDIAYGDDYSSGAKAPKTAGTEETKSYRDFYEDIYSVDPDELLCGCKKLRLPNGLNVDIICVNSCVYAQEPDYLVQGYVGEKQWNKIATELNLQPNKQTYDYRILVMHHHLMNTSIYSERPEPKKNYNVLLDAGSVSYKVRANNIKLVLHGHGHEGGSDCSAPRKSSNSSARNVYDVISLGSAGSSDLPPGESNTIGVLDFSELGKVCFSRYSLPHTQREKSRMEEDKKLEPIESFDIPIWGR